MKLRNLSAFAVAVCLLLSGCGQSGNSNDNSDVSDVGAINTTAAVPLNIAVGEMSAELNKLKSNPDVNIDWSNAVIGYPLQKISECYAVKLITDYEAYPEKIMTAEEQLKQFEIYCKTYLGEYNPEFACFDTAKREFKGESYTIDGIEDERFTAFPKTEDYKQQILNGEVKPTWYLYIDHIRQIYLWWSAESMIYPHWYNKGETLRSLDKYYKASSTIPVQIGEPVAVYPNDGSHNDESYRLFDGEVKIGEALEWFSNDFMKSLGIAENDIEKPAVKQIEVYRITDDAYAYVFLFTPTINGIPLDYAGEKTYKVSQGENLFKSETRGGQAVMIRNKEIDWAIGISPELYISEGEPITQIINLNKAADILSENLSEYIIYRAKIAELIMTADRVKLEKENALLMPMWKFTLQNDNDGFLYDFYIDAVSGKLEGYMRYEID